MNIQFQINPEKIRCNWIFWDFSFLKE
jgi:hypothetical protein